MVDYLGYYATDEDISGAVFNGESVPGDNTVSTARNTQIKKEIMGILHGKVLGKKTTDALDSDEYGQLNMWFLRLYERKIDALEEGKREPLMTDAEVTELRSELRRLTSSKPGLVWLLDPVEGE